jgi:DNA mismatch endonuclease, patch repair protein
VADFLTKAQRSKRMSNIRGRDTEPELVLRKLLHARGIRYRLHRRDLPGTPDLVLARYRVVVLVHGCFWHRHDGCNIATTPKTNTKFWTEKFERNVARDRRNVQALNDLGWRVYIVWECSLASHIKAKATADGLISLIVADSQC